MRLLTLLIFLCTTKVSAGLYQEYVYHEQPQRNRYQDKLARKSQAALMSFKRVKTRLKYFEFKIKKMTFGEYTDDVLLLTPLVTGKFELNINKLNF